MNIKYQLASIIFSFNLNASSFKDYTKNAKENGVDVELVYSNSAIQGELKFKKEDTLVFSFQGTKHTPFLIKDDFIYIANYNPKSSSDVEILKCNLINGKKLWNVKLGLDPLRHSKFNQRVEISFTEKNLKIEVTRPSKIKKLYFLLRESGQLMSEK